MKAKLPCSVARCPQSGARRGRDGRGVYANRAEIRVMSYCESGNPALEICFDPLRENICEKRNRIIYVKIRRSEKFLRGKNKNKREFNGGEALVSKIF